MDQISDDFVVYMSDLQDKASDLNELGQGADIYTALGNLTSQFRVSRHSIVLQGLAEMV